MKPPMFKLLDPTSTSRSRSPSQWITVVSHCSRVARCIRNLRDQFLVVRGNPNQFATSIGSLPDLHAHRLAATQWQQESLHRGADLAKTNIYLILAYEEGESLISAMLYCELTTLRKTGLTVPDSGIRDEYGLEPMDDLFSSPAKVPKPNSVKRSSAQKSANATISSEEDMDVGESMSIRPNVDTIRQWIPLVGLKLINLCFRYYSGTCGGSD